jgi:hypothetical protein
VKSCEKILREIIMGLWELKQFYRRKKVQEKANLSPLEFFKYSSILLKTFFFSFYIKLTTGDDV